MRIWACRLGVDLTRPTGGPFVGLAGRKISMLDGSEAGSTSNLGQLLSLRILFSQSGVICMFRALESPIPSDR